MFYAITMGQNFTILNLSNHIRCYKHFDNISAQVEVKKTKTVLTFVVKLVQRLPPIWPRLPPHQIDSPYQHVFHSNVCNHSMLALWDCIDNDREAASRPDDQIEE